MTEAIYVRQSKEKKDSLSIAGQIERCRLECKEPESARIYEDRGFSGKNTKRPGFRKMLEDVQHGLIEKIIVYRLDRLSRSILDFGQMWQELERNQVDFVSVNEKFDTSTPMGRAMIYIIMVFAQLERETIAERVADNYYTRVKKGNWPGGPAPFGMRNIRIINEKGQKVPSLEYTDDFAVVKEIYELYAKENVSLGDIAKTLCQRGVPCRKRKGWDNVVLSRILHSPVYVQADERIYRFYQRKGVKYFSNEVEEFDGMHSAHVTGKRRGSQGKYSNPENQVVSLTNFPGRIPADLWLMCQYKLEENRQVGNAGKGKHTWLSGLLKCGECGYGLTVRTWKDRSYLYCSGRGNLHVCDRKSFVLKPEEIEGAVQKELEKVMEEWGAGKDVCSGELQKVNDEIQNITGLFREASGVTMRYLNAELEKLDRKKRDLQKICNIFEKEDGVYFFKIRFGELSFEEKKRVAGTFIEKIMVCDESIEIVWKI